MLPYHKRRKNKTSARPDTWTERISAIVIYTLFFLCITPIFLTIVYRYIPPPATPLMVIRLFQGYPLHKTWKPLDQISPALRAAVIGSEDNLFCEHNGFDWVAINKAFERWQSTTKSRRPIKGGSTISQQTAKNVFLVPNRTVWRKVLELPLTALIEHLWPKQRILEIYLNIAEWGPGIYGAEAASNYYFKTSARNLTRQQAAQLAAVLPNPLHWSARKPGPYVAARSRSLVRRTYQLGELLDCTVPLKD